MAPKFPNPDPATDSVRDRLNQFVEVAGRAVYPPLAVAPSPATPGQIWWDVSSTVKIRDEANAAWADLLTVLGGQPAGSYLRFDAQTLTAPQQAQARTNIGAQVAGSYQPSGSYLRYDAQVLTAPQQAQSRTNIGLSSPSLSAQALGVNSNGSNYLDFYTASGQTWRILQSAASKSSGGGSSLAISYGFTFLTIPTVLLSNGNGLAIADLMLGAYDMTSSGFSVSSRDSSGTAVTAAYQVNYTALGRIA